MVPKLSQIAMPRPSPGGSGVPQPDIAATFSSTALKRGCSSSSSRRNSNGSLPAACAISSMNDSLKKPCCELSTERHCPSRIGCVGLLLVGALLGDGVGHEHGLAVAAARVVGVRGERHAGGVERAGVARHARRRGSSRAGCRFRASRSSSPAPATSPSRCARRGRRSRT